VRNRSWVNGIIGGGILRVALARALVLKDSGDVTVIEK
jgi:hypothetical protein